MTEFIVWLSIAVSHYRFRQGYVKQGYDTADLPYKAGLFPSARCWPSCCACW